MSTSIPHECHAIFTRSGGLDFEPLTFEPRPCQAPGCTELTGKGVHVGLYDKSATYAICPAHDEQFLRELWRIWPRILSRHRAAERAAKAERRAASAAKRRATP